MKNLPRLVEKYFGTHLDRLMALAAKENDNYTEPYFLGYLDNPDALEQRLSRLEPLGLIENVMSEVSGIDSAYHLDIRLRNAWAELRVADQLRKEGFQDIRKVEQILDFEARKDGVDFAVQVTRIDKQLSEVLSKLNRKAKDNENLRYGNIFGKTIQEIQHELEVPLSHFFWDAINAKNSKFKKWNRIGYQRCIALVTNDERLVNYPLESYIACQQIGSIVQTIKSEKTLYFDQLIWLPNLSNGAWFATVPLRCYCDWQNEPLPYARDYELVTRQEVDLDSIRGKWKQL